MANFTVTASGGFVAPNGTPWTMRGLNAGVQDALQGFGNVLKDYPGLTAIRLNCDSGNDSAASIAQVVQEYTAAGVVVEIEDHSGNGDNVAWYQQMATMFKGNPLVFLETPNEPSADAATTAQNQIGIINAIRAAGFANPIGLQPVGGYDQSNIPTVTAAVGTAGLFATPHIYYGVNDPNGAGQYVQSEIQGALQKGLFPSIDEFGNALDGFTADPQGMTVISSVLAANEAGQAGAVFWAMDNGNHPDGADSAFLNPAGTQLTPVGVDIQPWLSQKTGTLTGGGTTPPVTTPPVTTPPVTTTNPVLIKPGVGSFKDTAGNVYTVAANGDADENGNLMNGGTATGALELAKGIIYGQDFASGTWYTWNQSTLDAGGLGSARHYRHPARHNAARHHAARDDPARHDDQSCADQAGRWLVQGYRRQRLYGRREWRCRRERQSDERRHRHRRAGTRQGDYLRPGLCQQDLVHLEPTTWTQAASAPPAITVTPPVTTPPVTTPPVTTINPVKITPGVGSFKDTAGNVYTVSTTGNADENGNLMNGGTATGAMELAKGVIYGQDSATGTWYTWNQTTWTQAASAPPAPPAVSETGNHGSLTELLSQTGSYTVGGDTFVLTAGNAASVTLGTGTSQIKFIGASSITLTGGSGQSTVTADAGTNKFVAGTGTLDVTGGGGKDAYVFHANGGLLKLEDFSIAKGDTLTVDKTLQGAMHQASDGQGGTMITFGAGATHGVDIHGLATMPTTSVHWA